MVRAVMYGQVYHTPAWPAVLAGFGLVLCLVAAGLLFLDRTRGERMSWPALLLAPLGALALLGLALVAAATASDVGFGLDVGEVSGPLPWHTFLPLLLSELTLWCGAVLVLTLASWVRTLLSMRWHPAALLLPAGPAALGLLLAAVGPVHVAWFTAQGPLPMLEVELPPYVHLGHDLDATPAVVGYARPEACRVEPRPVHPELPGTVMVPLRARCPMLVVENEVQTQAGEDRGDPGFPLAVGNRWTWQHLREWHNQVLWFIPDRGREEGPILHLEVIGQDTSGPLTVWHLREQIEGKEPSEHAIYQWEGALRWFSDEGQPTDAIFFASGDPSEGEAHDPDGHTLVSCDFSLFSESACRCLPRPEGEAKLPGPSVCSRAPSAGDDVRTLGSVFLAVITAGLVVIDPDDDPRWVLRSSSTAKAP